MVTGAPLLFDAAVKHLADDDGKGHNSTSLGKERTCVGGRLNQEVAHKADDYINLGPKAPGEERGLRRRLCICQLAEQGDCSSGNIEPREHLGKVKERQVGQRAFDRIRTARCERLEVRMKTGACPPLAL